MNQLQEYIDRIVWSDYFARFGRLGKVVATMLRYLYAVLRDMLSGQLILHAMSLVYTTLLSIVPLLGISFAMAKGLGIFNKLRENLDDVLAPFGDRAKDMADQLLLMVEKVNGSVIGTFGVAFFLWTAISMIQKVEASFNYVWYVSKPRSLARRFTEYLVVLLVGPVVIATAFTMLGALSSNKVVGYLQQLPGIASLFLLIGKFLPYFMVCGVFTFLYMFIPNTRVKFRSALIGGIAGGVMWATVSLVFTTFILTSVRTFAVYASFAIGIVSLIWLYLNWLVLLIGAQLAFYVQNPMFLRIGRQDPHLSNGMRERLALNIMMLVGDAFRKPGTRISTMDISTRLNVPAIALTPIGEGLEQAGLLLTTEEEHLLPGREMSRIKLDEILDVVRSMGETGSFGAPTWSGKINLLGRDVDDAVSGVVGDRTLADLLDEISSA